MGTVSMFVYVAISLHLSHLPSLLSLLSGGNTKFLVKRKAFFFFSEDEESALSDSDSVRVLCGGIRVFRDRHIL